MTIHEIDARLDKRAAVDEKLAALEARKAQVVELKYFGGLKYEEIAELLEISEVTVRRDWTFSRAWLYAELRKAD